MAADFSPSVKLSQSDGLKIVLKFIIHITNLLFYIKMLETEKEMAESAGVFRAFDFDETKLLAKSIGAKRIIFAGMGSSILFPAKNAKARSFGLGIKNRVEAFFASELLSCNNFEDSYVILLSNSGMTKETMLLLNHLKWKNAKFAAVTAVADSPLAKKSKNKIIMGCGFEKGVAATKSVMEQALILDSLVFHLAKSQGIKINFRKLNKSMIDASEKILLNISLKLPEFMLESLSKAGSIYFAGSNKGAADEIALKTHEIAGKSAYFYPATHIVHGIEESIKANPIILFEPSKFKPFIPDFKKFSGRTGCSLFGIDAKDSSSIDTIKIKSNEFFNNYCLLAGGWGILRNVANELGINMDRPKKAVKVGNPYMGR